MTDYRQIHDTSDGWHKPGTCGACDKESQVRTAGSTAETSDDVPFMTGVGEAMAHR